MKETLYKELQRSQPDYMVYVPGSFDGSTHDGHNEHFLVFDGPDGSLIAIWTQNIGAPDGPVGNRIVFSRSKDEGVTWAPPKHLLGPATPKDPAHMASWAFPMVSKTGRIYVICNRNRATPVGFKCTPAPWRASTATSFTTRKGNNVLWPEGGRPLREVPVEWLRLKRQRTRPSGAESYRWRMR